VEITVSALQALRTALRKEFMAGFGMVEATRTQVSMMAKSNTSFETYGWLQTLPGMREWIGPRLWHNLVERAYILHNKTWENGLSVRREAVEDDSLGLYSTLLRELGMSCAEQPEQLVWDLLKGGFDASKGLAWDGQYFFDSDHLTWTAAGSETTFSNTGGGSGTAWFLADLSRPLKPVVFQERRPLAFTSKDAMTDDNVVNLNEFRYGADGRWNAGYGMYQLIYGSKATLDEAAVVAAGIALTGQRRPDGSKLPIKPDTLIVGQSNLGAALKVAEAGNKANGETNVWAGKFKVLHVPYLD
jgi:phage major head subunit gpT-like protein